MSSPEAILGPDPSHTVRRIGVEKMCGGPIGAGARSQESSVADGIVAQRRQTTMLRRSFLVSIPLVCMLASCGSSDDAVVGTSDAPVTSVQPSGGPAHSNDPDVALVVLDAGLNETPELVIGGDGWIYFAEADAPGPSGFVALVPLPAEPRPFVRRRLTDTGLAMVMSEADRLGLLAQAPDYGPAEISDSFGTSIDFTVDAGSFEHDAASLSGDGEAGNRRRLREFVEILDDLEGFVGADEIGPEESWVPDRFVVVESSWVTDERTTSDRTWPADVPVEVGCSELPTEKFPSGVAGDYVAAGTYLEVAPDLPGDICT